LAALAATLLLGPVIFWVAWNVLDVGHALGLPELGFWGVVLADAVPRRRLVRQGRDHRDIARRSPERGAHRLAA
jgi:hypothetical protein